MPPLRPRRPCRAARSVARGRASRLAAIAAVAAVVGMLLAAPAHRLAAQAPGGAPPGDPARTPSRLAEWLAGQPRLARALTWQRPGESPRPYPRWDAADRAELDRYFEAAAAGADLAVSDSAPNLLVPALVGGGGMPHVLWRADDARALFFAVVAHSLALEYRRAIPWSLLDYSDDDLAVLLGVEWTAPWERGSRDRPDGYRVSRNGFGIPAPPAVAARLVAEAGLRGADRRGTIERVVEWAGALSHFAGPYAVENMAAHWQYPGAPPVSRVAAGTTSSPSSYAPGGTRRWTAGCHGTVAVLASLLRTLNIPVRYVTVEGHAQPYFSSEQLYLAHGDDPYGRWWERLVTPQPTRALFVDGATWRRWFGAWVSPSDRRDNVSRRRTELGVTHISPLFFPHRCTDRHLGWPDDRSALLRANTGIARVYRPSELAQLRFFERLDAAIDAAGGCEHVAGWPVPVPARPARAGR